MAGVSLSCSVHLYSLLCVNLLLVCVCGGGRGVFNPCFIDYNLYCEEVEERGIHSPVPVDVHPMQVGRSDSPRLEQDPDKEFAKYTKYSFRLDYREYRVGFDSLSLSFSPVGDHLQMIDGKRFTVTVLHIVIVNYEQLSGEFFARNCPYLRELHLSVDYFTDEQGTAVKEKGVTVLDDLIEGLEFLEVLTVRIRPPCVRIENFLQADTRNRNKNNNTTPGYLDTLRLYSYGNGCDLSAVNLVNLESLKELYLVSLSSSTQPVKNDSVSVSSSSSGYIPPGFGAGSNSSRMMMRLFPRGLHTLVIRVPSFLEMMCEFYRERGRDGSRIRISGSKSVGVGSNVLMGKLFIQEQTEYVLPEECTGMFDALIFSLSVQHDDIKRRRRSTKRMLVLNDQIVLNSALWGGLVNRNWSFVQVSGIVSPEKSEYSFRPTVRIIAVRLRYPSDCVTPHPCLVLVSTLCALQSCSFISIWGDSRFSGLIDVRLSNSMGGDTSTSSQLGYNQGGNYSRYDSLTNEVTSVNLKDVSISPQGSLGYVLFESYYPKLKSITFSNSNVDVASLFENEYKKPINNQPESDILRDAPKDTCADIVQRVVKPSLTALSVTESNSGQWGNSGPSSKLSISEASFCKYPNLTRFAFYSTSLTAIMPGAFAKIPLKNLQMVPVDEAYDEQIQTSVGDYESVDLGYNVIVSGALFGHRESIGANFAIRDMPIRNMTEKLCTNSRERDWYFSKFELKNVSLVEFNYHSLCSGLCTENNGTASGYCPGVSNIDLSFNKLTSLTLAWADVYEIPRFRIGGSGDDPKQYTLTATHNYLTHLGVKHDLLPLQDSNFLKRNLTVLYANFNSSLEAFESNYEMPMALEMKLTLDFRYNRLHCLLAHSFVDMRSVSTLMLGNNGMDSIEVGFISGKSCLSYGCVLDMSNNHLSTKWPVLVGNLTKHVEEFQTPIRGLILRNNVFSYFPRGISAVFAYYRSMWNNASFGDAYATLDLSHNNISSVDWSVCSGLENISGPFALYVNLANNKLSYLSDEAFDCPSNVKLLVNLNNNTKLIHLPKKAHFLSSLNLLSVVNTNVSSQPLPCAYQLGYNEGLSLQSLAFVPSVWFMSDTDISHNEITNCCTLYRLQRNYVLLKSINPDVGENEGKEELLKQLREEQESMFGVYSVHHKTLKCFVRENGNHIVIHYFQFFGKERCGVCEDESKRYVTNEEYMTALWSLLLLWLVYFMVIAGVALYLFSGKPGIWEVDYGLSFLFSINTMKDQTPPNDDTGLVKEAARPDSYVNPSEGWGTEGSNGSSVPKPRHRYAAVVDALAKDDRDGYYCVYPVSEYAYVLFDEDYNVGVIGRQKEKKMLQGDHC
eukprot:Nk52_evm17s234 gene=Nk52_evmTU17s234